MSATPRPYISLYSLLLVIAAAFCEAEVVPRSSRHDRKLAVAQSPVSLTFHGGSVMSEGVNLYLIYYGTWNTSTTSVVSGFLSSLGEDSTATSEPNLKQWWSIFSEYNDSSGNYVNSNVSLKQTYYDTTYSLGTNFSINSTLDFYYMVSSAVTAQLPVDSNGIYIILTSSDVSVSYACSFCANYGYVNYNLVKLKFIWYPDTTTLCPSTCSAFTSTVLPPNGDVLGDSAVNVIALMLSNVVTNPEVNSGWFDSLGYPLSTFCRYTFGQTYIAPNLGTFNIYGNSNSRYLISEIYDRYSQTCALVPSVNVTSTSGSTSPPPPPSSPSSSSSSSSSIGIIIGVVVGVIVVLAIVVIVLVIVFRRKKKQQNVSVNAGSQDTRGVSAGQYSSAPSQPDGPFVPATLAPWISFEELAVATDSFSPANFLGKGNFGSVYKGYSEKGELWAVKRGHNVGEAIADFRQKASEIYAISHPNLVALKGYCDEGGEHVLVFEFIKNGSLRSHLDAKGGKNLSLAQRLTICAEVADALLYIHSGAKPVVHGNLTSANILLTDQLSAKVSDFNLPLEEDDVSTHPTNALTPYTDPEFQTTGKLTARSDVYSYGIILLEVVTGRPALITSYDESAVEPLLTWVNRAQSRGSIFQIGDPTFGSNVPADTLRQLVQLAQVCAQDRANARPTTGDIARQIREIKAAFMRLTSISTGDVDDGDVESSGRDLDYSSVNDSVVLGNPSPGSGWEPDSSGSYAAPVSHMPYDR